MSKLHGDVLYTPPLGLRQTEVEVEPEDRTEEYEYCRAIGIEKILCRKGLKKARNSAVMSSCVHMWALIVEMEP